MPLGVIEALSDLKTQARAIVRARFSNRAIGDANFLGKYALTLAMGLFGLHKRIERIDNDSPPGPKTSTLGLDTWAFTLGLPSNAGGYGRNAATASSGGLAPVTGTAGVHVASGQQLTAPDGTTLIELTGPLADNVIPFTGTFSALTPGLVGNLPIGTKLNFVSPPAGCDGQVVLSSALTGALPDELDGDLFLRELQRLQQPPKGGANIDYITWAIAQSGVFKAYVYPRRQGTGTVDLVIVAAGSGLGRIPSEPIRLAVVAFIASLQPTNIESAEVLVPLEPAGKNLSIRARAQLSSPYVWDWDDTGGALTVAAYNAGTPSLTLSGVAPASLRAAVDLGLKPRLQIVSSSVGAPVIPEQARVVAYDGTHLILTLAAPMTVAPTVGDLVFAGSYAAPLIAQNIASHIDELGTSRILPYADPINVWQDTASIFNIGARVTDALDADGITKLVSKVLVGGVTIAVGSGGPAAVDYQPNDGGLENTGPELVAAAHIYVTQ